MFLRPFFGPATTASILHSSILGGFVRRKLETKEPVSEMDFGTLIQLLLEATGSNPR